MDSRRIQSALRETPLVGFLPVSMRDRFVETVLDVSHADESRSGEVLFAIGERNTDEGIFVLEGAVKVTRANGEVRYLEAPDVLGEIQLFSPGGERTATVETVYGGTVLRFSWRQLGAESKSAFNATELAELRRAIHDTADAREKHLLKTLKGLSQPQK